MRQEATKIIQISFFHRSGCSSDFPEISSFAHSRSLRLSYYLHQYHAISYFHDRRKKCRIFIHRFISDISRILTYYVHSLHFHTFITHKCISIRDLSVSLIYRRRGISFRLFLRENRLMELVI